MRDEERVDVEPLGNGFWRVHVHYGFMNQPDVPRGARAVRHATALEFNMMETSFFLQPRDARAGRGRRRHGAAGASSCSPRCRATPAASTDFFKIPTNRVVELGTRVEI